MKNRIQIIVKTVMAELSKLDREREQLSNVLIALKRPYTRRTKARAKHTRKTAA